MKKTLLFIALSILSALFAIDYHVKISEITETELSLLSKHNIDPLERFKSMKEKHFVLTQNQLNTLKENRISFEIISNSQIASKNLRGYRNYSQLTNELRSIATNRPEIAKLISLGKSTAHNYYLSGKNSYSSFQHEIWCLKLSDNPNIDEDEPNILFSSGIHAREPISVEVNMNILNYLLDNYETNDSVRAWIDSTQIWFVPLMNPDGHKIVTDETTLMFRKNLRDNNENDFPDSTHVDGVDLNRNYGATWGDYGSSSIPYDGTYHGPHAWSEIETRLPRDLLRKYKFYAGISYHSFGEWLFYPLGHLPGVCSPDHEIMAVIADSMVSTTRKMDEDIPYTASQGVNFGACQGSMEDWAYFEQRIFFYVVELANTFIPADSLVQGICDVNLKSALFLLNRVNYATVTGNIKDNQGNPLVAEIIIPLIDSASTVTEVNPVVSDSSFGRYYRILNPGTYSITFRKTGYQDAVMDSVEIYQDRVTNLNITLHEVNDITDDIAKAYTITANNYPNPFNPSTTIEYSLPKNSSVELNIFNLKGQLVRKLINRNEVKGKHTVVWNGLDKNNKKTASGIYLYKLKTTYGSITNKILLLK